MPHSNSLTGSLLRNDDQGLLSASRSVPLHHSRVERDHLATAPIAFLHAWKTAVHLAGNSFFGDGTQASLDRAVATWELPPNLERISESLNRMTPPERVFIAALVSFYNFPDAARLLQRSGVSGLADLGALDLQRRSVIASLMLHYTPV
jgi:hypothetical protein